MNASISIDYREFDRAMVEYAAASGKDFAEVSNRQTLNLAIQGLAECKVATDGAIQKVQGFPWWPKYIAAAMKKRAGTKYLAKMMRLKSNKARAKTESSFGRDRFYSREDARTFSARIITKRLKAIRFMRFFFLALARKIQPHTKGGRVPSGKAFSGFTANIKPATASNPVCVVDVSYDYKKRSEKTAKKAERLLNVFLQRAVPRAARDIMKDVDRRMAETARRYSAS